MTDTYEVFANPYTKPDELLICHNQIRGHGDPHFIVSCHPSREAMVKGVLRSAKECEADFDEALETIQKMIGETPDGENLT